MLAARASFGLAMPVTLRMYCPAAASISSRVAGGSSPRSSVMFRHMRAAYDRYTAQHADLDPLRLDPLATVLR
jgi:hypothetical protein